MQVQDRDRLVVVDVGHGNSAVIHHTGGTIVIDTGPKSGLLEYLTEQEVEVIDLVLLSHADADHIGGLISLFASSKFDIKQVRLNTDSIKDSTLWDDLLYELDAAARVGELDFSPALTTNDSGAFDRGPLKIEILSPTRYLAARGPGSSDRSGRPIETNTISTVIRVSVDDNSVALFPGDLDGTALANLIEQDVNVSAPILVFPHHGGRAGATVELADFTRFLCERVSPQIVVFSIGRGKYNTPRPEVIRTLLERLPRVRIVCTQLSQHCASSLPLIDPAHLLNVFSRGRENRQCCAGTIVVYLDSLGELLPSGLMHNSFIDVAAPSALCRNVLHDL